MKIDIVPAPVEMSTANQAKCRHISRGPGRDNLWRCDVCGKRMRKRKYEVRIGDLYYTAHGYQLWRVVRVLTEHVHVVRTDASAMRVTLVKVTHAQFAERYTLHTREAVGDLERLAAAALREATE